MARNRQRDRRRSEARARCLVCGRERPLAELVPANLVRGSVAELIRRHCPNWGDGAAICLDDLHRFLMEQVRELLAASKGELDESEREVLDSIGGRGLIAENVAERYEERVTLGQRLADRVAQFGGSWVFIGLFGATIVVWMIVNSVALARDAFDPYPYILLNLVLSCLAAVQAPIIMMSQNRQEAKDRARAEHDYQMNLKAELEIRRLHEKLDHLILYQWRDLLEIQEAQAELIDELVARSRRGRGRGDEPAPAETEPPGTAS